MLNDILKDGRVQLVNELLSVANGENETGLLEYREVPGDGGPRTREVLRDLA
jgi:hypothetical protein